MAAGAFIRQLHQNLAYHPDRSFEELSTANAVDISRCVLNIWNRVQGNSVQAQPCWVSLHQRVEQYRKTEWNLTHIMQFQYFGIAPAFAAQQAGFVQIHNPLPASHIAYWNGDTEAALELWRQSPNHIDIVGRAFVHIVAENGDLEMMREIYKVNPGALRYAKSDLRGLNVLALTILS
ncbi:hypothetical protein LTS08_005492 [Lithohypha guttulata]|nr:hypothetical protein LTS08_005492 [Lithohypha guttulata]